MSAKLFIIISCIAALTLLGAGCSDDAVTPTGDTGGRDVVDGRIDPAAAELSHTLDTATGPVGPVRGPFVLRGRNIHYNDVIGALVVDFTVRNVGRSAYPEPVWVEFVKLLPDTVTVINPDNDEHGPGAAVMFEFTNDDAMWTPGEESLPRPVMFRAERGQAIGFVARIHVGMPSPEGGTIGGVVWHDRNEDGVRDNDEEGLPGVVVTMTASDFEDSMRPEILYRVLTGHDGRYRFGNLRAGQYEVRKQPNAKLIPTTPEAIQVILVSDIDGDISDFLEADFGCTVESDTRGDLEPGDFVRFSGAHNEDAHVLKARHAEIYGCSSFRETPCEEVGYMVAGTIREINRDQHLIRVMDVLITVNSDVIGTANDSMAIDDLEVGDRVHVRLKASPLLTVIPVALAIRAWDSNEDVLQGHVGRISPEGENRVVEIPALRSKVIVTPETVIGWILF